MTDHEITTIRDLAHWTAVRVLAEHVGDDETETDARIRADRAADALRTHPDDSAGDAD